MIDPVEDRYPRGSAKYQDNHGEYRRARLKPIQEDPSLRRTVYIFTDSPTGWNECVSDYISLVHGEHARRFYTVILHCDADENERRLQLPGRNHDSMGKLNDVEVLREYRSREDIYKFRDDDKIEIDITHIDANDAAEEDCEFVAKLEREGRSVTTWEEGGSDYDH